MPRAYRIVYAPLSDQTKPVLIDHGDRCIRVDPRFTPHERLAGLLWAVERLQSLRLASSGSTPYPNAVL